MNNYDVKKPNETKQDNKGSHFNIVTIFVVLFCVFLIWHMNKSDLNTGSKAEIPIDSSLNTSNATNSDAQIITDTNNAEKKVLYFEELNPISIIEAKVITKQIGEYNLIFKIKNTSNKTIDAVEFNYEKFNAFGEPLGPDVYGDKDIYINNRETIVIHQIIKPNATITLIGNISNQDKNLRKISAKATKVSYSDGIIWKNQPSLRNIKPIN